MEALGHSEGETVTENEVEPTCEEEGSYDSVVYCETCGEELSRETSTVEALGHEFGEWYESKAPNCTEEGEQRRDCGRCDHYETKAVEALGHEWSDWEVTLEPTYTTEGAQHRDCSVCGETQNEVTLKLPTDITISDADIVIGGKNTVSVNITEGSEVTAVQFVLKYDPSVLKVVSVTPGTAVADATINSGIEGLVIFAWDSVDAISTAETLLNIEFTTVKGAAACETYFGIDNVNEDFVFADENGKSIRYNISIGLITVIDVIYGDVDGNGKVNVIDANLIRKYVTKMVDFTEEQLIAADVDGNGRINIFDANFIRRYAAKLIVEFPVMG